MDLLIKPLKFFALACAATCVLVACGGAPSGSSEDEAVVTDSSVRIGSGGGASFTEGVLSEELISSGTSATWEVSVVVADENNIAVSESYTVTFTSTCVSSGLASLDNSTVTTVAGRASVTYSSGSCDGVDTVVASLSSGGSAMVDLDIDENTSSSGGGGGTSTSVSIGNGEGVDYEDGVLSVGSSGLQAGGSTTISASIVDENDELVSESITVTFTSPCVSNGLASFSQSSSVSSAGVAVTTYTADGCVGDDTITGTVVTGGEELSAQVTLSISADSVSSIEFISIEQPVLAFPGSGSQVTTDVTFQVNGELGAPVPGQSVSFELSSSTGGAMILPSRVTDISDENGRVFTTVQSGTATTTVTVTATHTASANSTVSDGIVISNGTPVQSRLTLSAETLSPADAWDTNGVEVDISVIASDLLGNDVPDGKTVTFLSPEGGNIDSQCTLVSGECSVVWRSSNPRPSDFRATIIAFLDGAEDFDDVNGNGIFDAGDTFSVVDDISEPFVDEDENGTHESNEYFNDVNSNGVRDDGNSEWDGPCLSAVDSSAICSGNDSVKIFKTLTILMPTEANAAVLSGEYVDEAGTTIDLSDTDNPPIIYTGNGGTAIVDLTIGDDVGVPDEVCNGLPLPPLNERQRCGNPLPPNSVVNSRILDAGPYVLRGATRVTLTDSQQGPTTVRLRLVDLLVDSDDATEVEVHVEFRGEDIANFFWPVVFGSAP